jgi:hypothetical protein
VQSSSHSTIFHISLLATLSKSCLARISSVSAPFPSIPDALESLRLPCHPDTTLTLPHVALAVQYTCNMLPPQFLTSVAVLTISHSFLRRFLQLLMCWKTLVRLVILTPHLPYRTSRSLCSTPAICSPPQFLASVTVLTISHSFLRRFLRLLMRWKALTRTVILPLRSRCRLSCFTLSSPPRL